MNSNGTTNGCCGPGAEVIERPQARSGAARSGEPRPTYRPAVDVYESRDEYVLMAEVPGAAREAVDIDYNGGTLTVRAGVHPRTPHGARVLHREYGVGDFVRSFQVGEGVDPDRITANLDAGVLTVRLPKAEAVRPRKIQVQAGA